jgi:transposase-like protein
VSATARRHGITRFQLNSWRKAHREGRLGAGSWDGFVPALVVQTLTRPWSLLGRLRRYRIPHAAPVGWTLSLRTAGM